MSEGAGVIEGVQRLRDTRRAVEASVLPLASSLDGRTFTFQASLHGLELRLGGYVVLEGDAPYRLGQILGLRLAEREAAQIDVGTGAELHAGLVVHYVAGEGALLASDGTPFHDVALRPAAPEDVRQWAAGVRRGRGAGLTIGELALAPGVTCDLHAHGFDRHTFLCGQSGSGKTYALGVMLEQLLMETRLRMVVLDPNSDFVRLSDVRDDADQRTAQHYLEATDGVVVSSSCATDGRRLRVRLSELDPAAQAAALRLDPVADLEEYAELVALLASGVTPTLADLEATGRPEASRLALRARNLGIDELGVWARDEPGSVLDALRAPAVRCLVVDLGSLATHEERALTAVAVLGELWRRRERRDPCLVVIDEAHNVCPARPEEPLTELATEQAVQIAAEGRKFGLYLLVSTQRPQKVHENVVTQCDNLVLMRLNARADAAFTQTTFSFVPPGLAALAPAFRLGEALVAGKISPHPALVRFGRRVSEEGGADVPATWAESGAPER